MTTLQKMRQVDAKLRDLPVRDRLCLLVAAIVDDNPDLLAASLGMANAIARLSQPLSINNKFRVAEALRDVADRLERSQRVKIEIG